MIETKNEFGLGAFIILCAPMMQGLYFDYQKYVFIVVVLIYILISLKDKIKIEIIENPIHWFCLGSFCLSLPAFFVAVAKGMHGISVLTLLLPALLLIITQQMVKRRLLYWMILTTFLNAFVSSFVFIFKRGEPDTFLRLIKNGRLGGSFQYANTYALFLGVGMMLILVSEKEDNKNSKLDLVMLVVMSLAFMFTMSRSSIYLISLALLFIGIGLKKYRQLLSCVLGSVLGLLTINFWALSKQITRLSEGTAASEWQTRLLYYRDAWHIILEHPLGLGHLGYYYIQRHYQTGSQYYVKFVHSAFIQQILDIGWVAGLLMIVIAFYIFVTKKIKWFYKVIIFVIIILSLIDIHFQFPVIILWIGLIYHLGIKKERRYYFDISTKRNKIKLVFSLILVTLVSIYLLVPTSLFHSSHYETASTLYPFYYESDKELLKRHASEYMEKDSLMLRMEKNNAFPLEVYVYKRDLALLSRDYEKAIVYSQKCIELNPLRMSHYEIYGRSLYEFARVEVDKEKQLEALRKCLEIPDQLLLLANERDTDYNVMHKPTYKPTPTLIDILEKAKELGLLLER